VAKVQEMIGPNLAAAVKAADLQDILIKSRSPIPGQIDGQKFVAEVMRRYRAGMLDAVHGPAVTGKLLKQVQDLEMLSGRLDVATRPGDTMSTLATRIRETEAAIREEAKRDPLKLLEREMKKLDAEKAKALAKTRAVRRSDPLGFLYEPSTGASDAVDRILRSEDLMFATEARFGRDSPEFKMLQQVWLERILQGDLQPSRKLEKWSPEIQALMAPGTTQDQLQTLAKNMDFLLETRAGSKGTAKSMSAMSKVEHPLSQFVEGDPITKAIITPAMRMPLGAYYAFVRKLVTSPSTLRWLAKGLKGTQEQREIARDLLLRSMSRGGSIGAGTAEATSYAAQPEETPPNARIVIHPRGTSSE